MYVFRKGIRLLFRLYPIQTWSQCVSLKSTVRNSTSLLTKSADKLVNTPYYRRQSLARGTQLRMPPMNVPVARPKIVIIGAGYGGCDLGLALLRLGADLTIIDVKDYFYHNIGAVRAVVEPGWWKKKKKKIM